ncbi:glycosyltransferase family 61 protein [Paracoccus sp. M683]|uniref:glycosyltransferase 61 family protein n=1 Tax=Paracoccus sp. M683 TaxID=2594268 RepID=UPI00117CDDAF|nr:glycosyltransferase family 61 protein [Paracoccus sp. M683]TRW95939.1 glycosyltransferase family 61 protein [Paracoccus sp. M683]
MVARLQAVDRGPDEAFLVPGLHPGVTFVGQPTWLWRETPRNPIQVINCAEDADDQAFVTRDLARTVEQLGETLIEFNSVAALLAQPGFERGLVTVGGRYLLSGSAGLRARTKYYLADKSRHRDMARFLFAGTREQPGKALSWTADIPDGVDICLDCRNFTNYYHFMVEVMTALHSIQNVAAGRKIRIHSPNPKVTANSFAMRLIAEYFPDIMDSVEIVNDINQVSYDACLFPFLTDHLYYLLASDIWGQTDGHDFLQPFFQKDPASLTGFNQMRFHKMDGRLVALRQHMLAVAGPDGAGLPRKVLVDRKPDDRGARTPDRWADMTRELMAAGFERVFFEELPLKQQVQLVNNAETVVAVHGAGVTNMMFAGQRTRFIEIGNRETLGGRLAAFAQLAQASRCDYRLVVADQAAPEYTSTGRKQLSRIRLTDRSIAAVLAAALSD